MAVVLLIAVMIIAIIHCTIEEEYKKAAKEEEAQAKESRARQQAEDTARLAQARQAQEAELARLERDTRERAEADAKRIVEQATGLSTSFHEGLDPTSEFTAIDQSLRRVVMMRLVRGKNLTVKYIASPTGRIGLEWIVTEPPPFKELWVALNRYDPDRNRLDLQMQDAGLSNCWGGQVNRGETVRFVLQLLTERERLLDRVEFVIYIPKSGEWGDTVEPIDPPPPPKPATPARKHGSVASAMQREIKKSIKDAAKVRTIREKAYEQIEGSAALTDDQKEDEKASVDSAIARAREKHEES